MGVWSVAADVAVKVTIVGFVALAAARLCASGPARLRYRLWIAALLAAAVVPIVALGRLAMSAAAGVPTNGFVALRATPASVTTLGFVVWLTVAAVMIGGLIRDLAHLRAMRRAATQAPGDWQPDATRLATQLGIEYPVRIVVSDQSTTPMCWGVWRPTIVLPTGWQAWSPSLRESVLRHELRHLSQCDPAVRVLERMLAALLWFCPAIWLIVQRTSREREVACDESVLAAGADPFEYASELVMLAKLARHVPAAAQAFVRQSELEHRVAMMLDHRTASFRRTMITSLAAAVAIAGVISAKPVVAVNHVSVRVQSSDPPGAGPATFRTHPR